MTLDQLIEIADQAYNDDGTHLIKKYHQDPEGKHGDTLARFIVIELTETYDIDATETVQRETASDAMTAAENQLHYVSRAIDY
jgi:hypothetical protein